MQSVLLLNPIKKRMFHQPFDDTESVAFAAETCLYGVLPAQLLSAPKVHCHTATQGWPIACSGLLRARHQQAESATATNPDLAQSWQQVRRCPQCIRAKQGNKGYPVKIATCDLGSPLASAPATAASALPANESAHHKALRVDGNLFPGTSTRCWSWRRK